MMIRFFALLFVASLLVKRPFAQDSCTLPVTVLREVVVPYQADKLTPVTFQNISIKDIKVKSVGQEPSFLFSQLPAVTNYSDAGNSQGYSYFRMRGIDQTRINITLDGVPMNEPEDQGGYFSNFPDLLNSISKIQVQRGTGTTKNGVASYGGSIELFSPNLYDSAGTTFGVGYGSFNSLRAFGEYNSGVKNGKAIYVRGSEIYSDGYKYNSSNHSQSVFVSGAWFGDKTAWKLNILAGHQRNQLAWIGVADSLIAIDRKTNANRNEKDKFTQWLTQLLNRWRLGNNSYLQSGLYYSNLKGNYDFNLNNFLGLPTTDELYNYAFQSNLTGFFSNYNATWKRLKFTVGVHGNVYNRQHTFSEKALGRLYRNTGYKNEASAFAKAIYNFNRFSFFTDVQYRYTEFDYRGTVPLNKLNWEFVNPKAGISAEIKTDLVAYYSIGRTGREPTRNDMFMGNDDLLADSAGNPVISATAAEYVVDQELGIRFQSKRWNVNLNGYYMNFENEIVLNGKFGPNGLALTNNVEKSFRTGIELSATWHVTRYFSLVNNSSYNYSRIKEQKVSFQPVLTPPVIINQEAIYAWRNFSVAAAVRYQHRSFIDFANTATVKSYTLLNARVGYNFNRFQLTVFADNITNVRYFNNGYVDVDGSKKYFVQAPTTVYASLKIYLMMHLFDIKSIAFSVLNYQVSYVELIGTLFGLISVYYASRANILTWPTGIVNELFLFILFFQVQLYADMFLQVYFFIVTIYGWYNWRMNKIEKKVSFTSFSGRMLLIAAMIMGTIAFGYLFRNIHTLLPAYFATPASYPFADSFIMVSSILATILLARKKIENWVLWIIGDVVCVVLYFKKQVYFLSLEYLVFLGLASYGLYHWNQKLNMVKAFVFGKFMPFHKGHEAMIRFALGKCDFLTVLVCVSNKETVPGGLRQSWISETFADHKNILVQVFDYKEDELPNSSVASTAISEVWAKVFKQLLPDHSLLITSEPYGDYVAGFMHIQHIPFDLSKTAVPVSATAVRNNLMANWQFLPDAVRRHLSLKVVILGTESTGKTTLTENLAAYFNCSKVLEAGRDLIPDSNAFSIDDLYLVAREHAKRIDEAAMGNSALVIIDTDIHITKSYCRYSFEKELDVSGDIYRSNKAQLYLYLNNDVEYYQDGTRLSKEDRDKLDAFHRQVIKEARLPVVEISGSWEERFQQAVEQTRLLLMTDS